MHCLLSMRCHSNNYLTRRHAKCLLRTHTMAHPHQPSHVHTSFNALLRSSHSRWLLAIFVFQCAYQKVLLSTDRQTDKTETQFACTCHAQMGTRPTPVPHYPASRTTHWQYKMSREPCSAKCMTVETTTLVGGYQTVLQTL